MRSSNSERLLADVASWGLLYWVGVALAAGITAVNLYVGYVSGERVFVVIGLSFLFGVVLFFSRFWHPVLYLLGVLHIGGLGVMWFLSGRQYFVLGGLSGVLSLGLAAIAMYLFFKETSNTADG